MQITLAAIYGLHTVHDRQTLWEELRELDQRIQSPWLLLGDYNAVLSIDDRTNGNAVQDSEIKDFRDFINDTGMTELPTRGRKFTWTNNHVSSKIDRALVNTHWMLNMEPVVVQVLDPLFSDHSPLALILGNDTNKGTKPFRFFNCWAAYPHFTEIVQESSNTDETTTNIQEVWAKLKEVKKGLKNLNNKEFKWVAEKIKEVRGQLQELQVKMRDPTQAINTYDTEKLLKEKLEKWNLIEESIYKQKSRNKWLKEGDCNIAYFFASAKSRKAQNLSITL
ncbi:uncharacterized protein LOC132631036 [Lycium barbarum]|uniref:uncharacterized protein LOC132631036 n=1 Tax=Lycium barbarum TaxID=112863 RepID=UPI00293E3F67|nr:uncharacterized protein LOC132631036 [Lycium barbarum]